ncbi:MAG TPA: glutaminyl-peptide cyclotransferase [Gammaproteobacteria bacterium]|nr:glutaminyl-peptide cyclotransferase [Gammaproteobacteria bacterium]
MCLLYPLGLLLAVLLPAGVGHAQETNTSLSEHACQPAVEYLPHVDTAPAQRFEIIARYPHDPDAFTQGLVFYRGELYESTGLHGRSSIRRLDLETGKVLRARHLDKALFGEGLTVHDRKLVQLTWETGSALLYTPSDLRRTGQFTFDGEGWGNTVVHDQLVISDGSSFLRFYAAPEYRQVASLQVTDHGRPVEGLNELEFVEGLIYANVYPTDCIARIDAHSGQVTGWIDLRGLMPLAQRPGSSAVANGIAYDTDSGNLLVTGKFWPYLYRLRLLDNEHPGQQAAGRRTSGWRL